MMPVTGDRCTGVLPRAPRFFSSHFERRVRPHRVGAYRENVSMIASAIASAFSSSAKWLASK
jgi:hypothetical protein